jgi:hypothetical protein
MSATSTERRLPRVFGPWPLTFVISALCIVIARVLGPVPRFDPDNHWYLALAQGHVRSVNQPFAQRVLHPWIVRGVHAILPVSWRGAFVVVAVVALVAFVALMLRLLPPLAPFAVVALLVSPWVVSTFRDALLPDLVFAVAVLALVAAIRAGQRWAPLLVAVLFMMRETALVVALVWLVIVLRRRDYRTAAFILGASAVGYLIATLAARAAHPSLHEIGGIPYLIGKVPFNFMKQIVSVPVWTNDVAGTRSALCAKPAHTWHLPGPLHQGAIDEVGLCGFQSRYILGTVSSWLTAFGTAPAFLAIAWWRTRGDRMGRRPDWLTIALWTGVIGFVLAPVTGTSIWRLVGYGWPAMLLALPWLLVPFLPDARSQTRLFVFVALSAWVPWVVQDHMHGQGAYVAAILIAIPFFVVAIAWARRLVSTRALT